jgi:uncharacterized membrane protein YozB (DUF420 family)
MVTFQQVHELMAQANLLIQSVLLLLIVLGIVLARKRNFNWHGNTMLVAVLINGLLLVSHMGPAMVRLVEEGINQLDTVTLLGMTHGVVGAVAEFLGIWLVGMWVYGGTETKYCMMRKKWMWKIVILWTIALGLGYVYYVLHIAWG